MYMQRASQIRSSPFTGDSSDDSSDGEGEHTNTANTHSVATRITNSSSTDNTDTSLSSSSPSKSHKTASTFSPVKHNSSGSPSKSTNSVQYPGGGGTYLRLIMNNDVFHRYFDGVGNIGRLRDPARRHVVRWRFHGVVVVGAQVELERCCGCRRQPE